MGDYNIIIFFCLLCVIKDDFKKLIGATSDIDTTNDNAELKELYDGLSNLRDDMDSYQDELDQLEKEIYNIAKGKSTLNMIYPPGPCFMKYLSVLLHMVIVSERRIWRHV